jgi:hypothetical protein
MFMLILLSKQRDPFVLHIHNKLTTNIDIGIISMLVVLQKIKIAHNSVKCILLM